MLRQMLGIVCCAALATACGGESSGAAAATSPSPVTTSIAVTLASPIRIGGTTQATATATLTGGQSQPVTTGWQSDTPSVATVTTGGLVTGVSNGRATIYVISGGRQGQEVIRVVPDYQGRWVGRLGVTSCSQSGAFATADFCGEFAVGTSDPFALQLTQSGETLTAAASYGDIVFSTVSAPIAPDGSSSFKTTYVSNVSSIVIEGDWNVNGPRSGSLIGTVTEVWRAPGIAGEGRLVQDIVGASRPAGAALSFSAEGLSGKSATVKRRPR